MNESDRKNASAGIPESVEKAVKRLLRPLMRLLLSFQITYPILQEWLKQAYVEVADKEFPLPDKPQTDTRVSLLTGIHRKDVKRLRHSDSDDQQAPEHISQGVQIVAHWAGHPDYLSNDGNPLPLPFSSTDSSPSFSSLVECVCRKDIRARVVLDEWQRLGMVTLSGEGSDQLIHLRPGVFVPDEGVDEKAFFLGMNIADHLAAATVNVLQEETPMFERCMYYDGLSSESVEELKQLAAEQGMATLKALNARALELKKQDSDNAPAEHNQRINVGLYVYDEVAETVSETAVQGEQV